MENAKISIIVPVYKAEKTIDRCITSILGQTIKEIEILLIDDGSPDRSLELCNKWAETDSRVRVLHKENGGVSSARNMGIAYARAPFIQFVDADDCIEPYMCEVLFENACKNSSDIVICGYNVVNQKKSVPANISFCGMYSDNFKVQEGLLKLYYTEYKGGLYSPWNKLYATGFIKKNGILFDQNLVRAEDAWFNFYCLKVANSVCVIGDPLYNYYQNPDSAMHTTFDNQFDVWVATKKRLLEENKELDFEIDFNLFYKDFLYKVAVFFREMSVNNKKNIFMKCIENDLYRTATKYSRMLPIHIKVLHWLTVNKCSGLAFRLYKLWGMKNEQQ